MEVKNTFREKQQKNYTAMRTVYDLTMAVIILAMAAIMFFGNRLGLEVIAGFDPLVRYIFGGLCVVYGSFRLYRAIRHDY